jgi:hypothetical protein
VTLGPRLKVLLLRVERLGSRDIAIAKIVANIALVVHNNDTCRPSNQRPGIQSRQHDSLGVSTRWDCGFQHVTKEILEERLSKIITVRILRSTEMVSHKLGGRLT